jgi:hypothetical protein
MTIGRVAGVAVCMVWARMAAAQTPPTGASPTPPPGPTSPALPPLPPPDEASSPALPPLPPPAPDEGAGAPATGDTLPRVDSVQPGPPHHDADTTDDADAPSATATAPPSPWATQPLVLEAQFGLGTPLGLAGIAMDYSPVPILGLNLGVGLGLGGVQYAFASRLRVVRAGRRKQVALYLSGGVSGGAFNTEYETLVPVDGSQGGESPVAHYHWDAAYWTNLEAGVEIRVRQHLSLRPFAGAAFLLNPSAGTAVIGQYGEVPAPAERWIPYMGIAIGYAVRPGW